MRGLWRSVFILNSQGETSLTFDLFRWSVRSQRLRFDSSETLIDKIRTAIGQRSVAEDIAVADRVEEGDRALVVSTRTAWLSWAGRAVALFLPGVQWHVVL